ncbi:MAG: BON domain-containing protein [Alphaproteobacteria bacterium]|jgi:osmotically-inducible protein OsmY|nr:BON domain-containing protein [Alphaproteobacteria bacterium]
MRRAFLATALASSLLLTGCGVPMVLGAGAAAGYVGLQTRPSGQVAADTDTKVRVKAALASKNYRFLGDIGTDVFYNDVLVTGVVPTRAEGEQVIALIQGTTGVRKVYNELFVGDAYTTAQRAKDAWIAAQIKPRLIGTKGVFPLNYMISVVNNHVYALGSVSGADERNNVLHLLRTTPGVAQVHDYLVIVSPTPEGKPNIVNQGAQEDGGLTRRAPNPLPDTLR